LSDLTDISKPVFFSEGEKKIMSLDKAAKIKSIPAVPIGIGGVWAWRFSPKELQPDGTMGKGKSRAIEDFDLIEWAGRKVYIFFDSDVATNPRVAIAETALARELAARGADVYIVRFARS
jgi:putative DNA primase/helicase